MATTMRDTPRRKSPTTAKRGEASGNETRFPTHDEIALRAHQLYEQSGYQSGRDAEFWLEAERQLREESRR